MIKENQDEENPQVTMKMESYYITKGDGMVIIYKVTTSGILDEFYVATFDNMSSEVAWGLGPTPRDALLSAAREWDLAAIDEDEKRDNPFRQVLEEQFSQ